MKKLLFFASLAALVLAGCDKAIDFPVITLKPAPGTNAWDEIDCHPFRVDPDFEKKFVYRRDRYHHHYTKDKDGNWSVEYVKECPDKRKQRSFSGIILP